MQSNQSQVEIFGGNQSEICIFPPELQTAIYSQIRQFIVDYRRFQSRSSAIQRKLLFFAATVRELDHYKVKLFHNRFPNAQLKLFKSLVKKLFLLSRRPAFF